MSTEKTARTPMDAAVQNMMDIFGNFCWAQEQGDRVLRSYVELGNASREEARQWASKMTEQVRENQEQMQKWVRSAVEMSMASFRPATVAQLEALERKVDELTKKVEALSAGK